MGLTCPRQEESHQRNQKSHWSCRGLRFNKKQQKYIRLLWLWPFSRCRFDTESQQPTTVRHATSAYVFPPSVLKRNIKTNKNSTPLINSMHKEQYECDLTHPWRLSIGIWAQTTKIMISNRYFSHTRITSDLNTYSLGLLSVFGNFGQKWICW